MKPRLLRRFPALGLIGASLVGYAGSFAVSKVIAVQFGPSGLGIAGALLGIAAIVASLAVAGQLNNLALWIASRPDARDRLSALSGLAATALGIPLGLAAALVLRLSIDGLPSWPALLLGGAALVIGQILVLQRPALLAALEGPSSVTRFTLIYSIVSMGVTILLLVVWPQDLLILALGLGAFAGGVVGGVSTRVRQARQAALPGPREVVSFITSGARGMPGVVVNALAMGGLPVFVVLVVGSHEAGLFRAIWGVTSAIWALSMTVQKNVYFPRACRATDASEFESLNAGTSRSVLMGSAIASSLVSIASPFLLWLLYSRQFVPASTALSILSVGALLRVWIGANNYFVFARGRQGTYSLLEAFSVVMLVSGVLIGSMVGSATAMAVGATAGLLAAALTSEFIARRLDVEYVPTAGLSQGDRLLVAALVLLPLLTSGLR